jgi:hypothetical protein
MADLLAGRESEDAQTLLPEVFRVCIVSPPRIRKDEGNARIVPLCPQKHGNAYGCIAGGF